MNPNYRGQRLSEVMIKEIIVCARKMGFKKIYIHSSEFGLYEKFGFKIIDCGKTCSGDMKIFMKGRLLNDFVF